MAISTITVPEAGTYYLGNTPKSNYIFKVQVSDEVEIKPTYKEVTTVLNANDLESVAQGTKADGDVVKAGEDDFFIQRWI